MTLGLAGNPVRQIHVQPLPRTSKTIIRLERRRTISRFQMRVVPFKRARSYEKLSLPKSWPRNASIPLLDQSDVLNFVSIDSQQGAVDALGEPNQPPKPSKALDALFWIVDVASLGSFLRYLTRLNEVRDTLLTDDQWRDHIWRLVKEWEEFNLIVSIYH